MLAYTTGRGFVKLGAPPTCDPAVIAVSDDPGSASAPETFYLENAMGQRTGWIEGQSVSEMPRSEAADIENQFSEPGVETEPGLGPSPRTISVLEPSAGTTLHVQSAHGGPFALHTDYWSGGKVLARDLVEGVAPAGAQTRVASAALEEAIAATPAPPSPAGGGGGTERPATTKSGQPAGAHRDSGICGRRRR